MREGLNRARLRRLVRPQRSGGLHQKLDDISVIVFIPNGAAQPVNAGLGTRLRSSEGSRPRAENGQGTLSRAGDLLGPFDHGLRSFGQRRGIDYRHCTAIKRQASTLHSCAAFWTASSASAARTQQANARRSGRVPLSTSPLRYRERSCQCASCGQKIGNSADPHTGSRHWRGQ